MAGPGTDDIDPLEGGEPRPTTVAERRIISAVGVLLIVAAVGILLHGFGLGVTPTSVRDELNATRPAQSHAAARHGE
jgi:hypothetical protein